jgi:hypothetical protein
MPKFSMMNEIMNVIESARGVLGRLKRGEGNRLDAYEGIADVIRTLPSFVHQEREFTHRLFRAWAELSNVGAALTEGKDDEASAALEWAEQFLIEAMRFWRQPPV